MSIKEMVAEGRKVRFVRYKLGELWYRTETGFEFPVPVSDCDDGTFLAEDRLPRRSPMDHRGVVSAPSTPRDRFSGIEEQYLVRLIT